MNWLEINKVLEELPLEGAFLQNIRQSSYKHLIFECRRPGLSFNFLICLDRDGLRIHQVKKRYPSLGKPPRFTAYMRSRIKGARIVKASQIGADRIIELHLKKGDAKDILYIRLWGGAANLILCDSDHKVLDAFSRRPAKKEMPGETFDPAPGKMPAEGKFLAREKPSHFESYNQFLETAYAEEEQDGKIESLKSQVRKALDFDENALKSRIRNLKKRLSEYEKEEEYRNYADLLMSSLHLIQKGWSSFTPDGSSEKKIPLDTKKSAVENAQAYYKKAGKAAKGRQMTEEELELSLISLEKVQNKLHSLNEIEDPEVLKTLLPSRNPQNEKQKESGPGLHFKSANFDIIVGRSAKENEALLSHKVRGNDYWMHTRDYPGAYVFIRLPKGKSIPLETLLDAANLALFYSKAKSSGAADLYYTQVKYLRKAKNGKTGLVIPTKEKNFYVKLDESRIARLKGI